MAHLTIQYSYELEKKYDFKDLVDGLRLVMARTGVFPVGGIRVRAWPTIKTSIADGHIENKYVDLFLRMGKGRSKDEKQNVGNEIMTFSSSFFKNETEKQFFALALEIVEIDPELSWKINTIHSRIDNNKKK